MNKIIIAFLLVLLASSPSYQVNAHEHETDAETEERGDDHKMGKRKGKRARMQKYMLERVDSNEDGKIELSEYLANAEERFKNMDIDGDGFVTSEEHKESIKLMREKHRAAKKKLREERKAESDGTT